MSNATSLFGQYLTERGISLVDYAEMTRERKVAIQDEYDAYDWRTKSQAAAAEAAKVPSNFFVWLMGAHQMDQAAFDHLSAIAQNKLANGHHYALSTAKKAVETAKQKPVVLPKAIQDMPEGMAKNRAILDHMNRKSLEDGGYIPQQECGA